MRSGIFCVRSSRAPFFPVPRSLLTPLVKNPKIVRLSGLLPIARSLKKDRKNVVFTNGCFDLVHAGHVRYLKKARALGDVLIVGVNSDASIRRIKGPSRPLVRLEHRQEVLAALECVSYVVSFDEDTPERLIRAIQPDILVKGADYRVGQIAGAHFVLASGGKVRRIGLVKGLSTTGLLSKLKSVGRKGCEG